MTSHAHLHSLVEVGTLITCDAFSIKVDLVGSLAHATVIGISALRAFFRAHNTLLFARKELLGGAAVAAGRVKIMTSSKSLLAGVTCFSITAACTVYLAFLALIIFQVSSFFALGSMLSRLAFSIEESTFGAHICIFIKVLVTLADDALSLCVEKSRVIALVAL